MQDLRVSKCLSVNCPVACTLVPRSNLCAFAIHMCSCLRKDEEKHREHSKEYKADTNIIKQ